MAVMTHYESDALFSWKGESLKEYWGCILNALIYPEDDGKGHRPDLIVDDGCDMTLLIHDGKKAEVMFLKDVTIPEPRSTEKNYFNIFQTIIKSQLEGGETAKWNKMINTRMGVSEEITGVKHLYTMKKKGTNHQKRERTRMEAMCAKIQAKHILPHPSTFPLLDLLIDISNLHCGRSPHPDIRLVLLCLLTSFRNCANREALG